MLGKVLVKTAQGNTFSKEKDALTTISHYVVLRLERDGGHFSDPTLALSALSR